MNTATTWATNPAAVESARAVARRIACKLADPGGEIWRGMPERVRVTLYMLAFDAEADPVAFIRRPWGSYTEAERLALGSVARTLQAGLSQAGFLK